jgi:maltooligosyltrehalose trehalohydrolase
VLRFFADSADRLLVVNLGRDLHLDPAPEPLLAPIAGGAWELIFSTEDPRYGGSSTAPVESDENWRIPARSALVLAACELLKPA